MRLLTNTYCRHVSYTDVWDDTVTIGGQSGTGHIYLNIHLTKGFLIEHIDRLAPLFSRTDSNEEDQVGVSHIYGNLDGE